MKEYLSIVQQDQVTNVQDWAGWNWGLAVSMFNGDDLAIDVKVEECDVAVLIALLMSCKLQPCF